MDPIQPFRAASLAALLASLPLVLFPPAARAQDVEMLGRMHGTRPPQAYYDRIHSDPTAFTFGRAWKARTGLGRRPDQPRSPGVQLTPRTSIQPAAVTGLGRRHAPVTGTITFPMILGLFADSTSTPSHTRDEVQREYFDGPNSRYETVTQYYDAVSGGRVHLEGRTYGWIRSDLTQAQVTGTTQALGTDSEIGEFIENLAAKLDSTGIDWGQFDNDGPDGIPNSGDDDGYVDVLAVMQPEEGAECGSPGSGGRIWSHRWQISAALKNHVSNPGPYVTSTPSANGGYIKVDDYAIFPLLACDQTGQPDPKLNQIGVIAHELGHGFGVPDLYGTGSRFLGGAGDWGLMGTGSWGCNHVNPAKPCHMSAWTKYVLGWVPVDTIPAGAGTQHVTLNPVETGGRVLRVDGNDGSGTYYLLAYRDDPHGFDQQLYTRGLLIWQVDRSYVDSEWVDNRVNATPSHAGVWLRQADGLNELMTPGGGRGDAGDAYPGITGNTAFDAGTDPASLAYGGAATGLTVTNIREGSADVSFDVENRYYTVTLQTQGDPGGSSPFTVDGTPTATAPGSFATAPFQHHVIEAPAGATISPGVRTAFQGWEDGSCRVRDFEAGRSDTLLVATYGGRAVHFDVSMTSPSDTVTPGAIQMSPSGCDSGWVPQGDTVTVKAVARTGFSFQKWTGAFAGMSNPLTMDASAPLTAGATFDLTYSVASNPSVVDLVAAEERQVTLQTTNGNEPVTWTVAQGSLPDGFQLHSDGTLVGAPLLDGTFPVRLRARDAIGLQATVDLQIVVSPPKVGTAALTAPFLLAAGGPTQLQEEYLDRSGNNDGAYDVGDLRAFLARHPDTPETVRAASPRQPIVLPPVRLIRPASPAGGARPTGEGGGGRAGPSGRGGVR